MQNEASILRAHKLTSLHMCCACAFCFPLESLPWSAALFHIPRSDRFFTCWHVARPNAMFVLRMQDGVAGSTTSSHRAATTATAGSVVPGRTIGLLLCAHRSPFVTPHRLAYDSCFVLFRHGCATVAPGLEGVRILTPPFRGPRRLVIGGITYGQVPETHAAAEEAPTLASQKATRALHILLR